MNHKEVVIEKTLNVPIEKVWKAITDNEEMKHWYFKIKEFKPVASFEFDFSDGPPDRKYLHLCKVTDVVPGKKIAYTWRYDEYPGNSLVTWELTSEGDKTKIKLTHTGIESFKTGDPNFSEGSHEKGWTYIIDVSLRSYLENK